jgi:peptidyl-prolyl cis-trans isomerase D
MVLSRALREGSGLHYTDATLSRLVRILMLAAVRTFAKSWVAAVLIGLLIVSFAVFGIHDVFRQGFKDAVVVAGDRTVSSPEFKRMFENAMKSVSQQNGGQPIPLDVAAANGLDKRVLQSVAQDEAFAALLQKIGLRIGDKQVAAEIQKIPGFFDRVSGRFDKATYQQLLGQNGLTPEIFERSVKDDLENQQMASGIVSGLRLPRAYAAIAAIYQLETRDVAWFTVEPSNVAKVAPPSDAQLTAFMKENAAQLTKPEFRVITVVRFSPAAVAPGIAVSEDDVKKRYEFRKDTYATPETRTVVQIPAKDAAAGQKIAAGLSAGQPPAVVAKSVGVDAITYDAKPQTAISDRKVAVAAFAMAAGQVAPVQGDLGMAVIKVVSVTPGKTVPLEQARPVIEAELKKDAAGQKVYDLTQAYDDAHQKGASLTEAAQKAGVPALTMGPLSKEGRDPQGQPVMGLSQKLVDTAFSLPEGGESEVQDAGGGEYFAVHIDRITPPALPALAEVREQLARVWTMRETAKLMQAKADSLAERVRKGETLDAVASSAGAKLSRVAGVSRQTAQQNKEAPQEVLGNAFGAKAGEVFTANSPTGIAVGRLEGVHAGDGVNAARLTEMARPQMTNAYLREINETARLAATQKVKVKADYAKARAAIGLEAEQPAAGAAKK